jgi:hypothetical protein
MQTGKRGLGIIVVIAAALVGCASGSSDDRAGTATGAATATDNKGVPPEEAWVNQWGSDSTKLRLAMNVKTANPFTFALSAIEPNTPANKVDAHDLTADFVDGTKKTVLFAKGDCALALQLGDLEVKLDQTGACTSIGVPDGMTLDTTLFLAEEVCWDGNDHAFKQAGQACVPPPGF